MKENNALIHLGPGYTFNAIDYANQGNTILGIRGSGKTWAATKVGEELLDAGIPIVGFDPTGVWPYLRHGINGHPGYAVVVAGGLHPDIELTVENATRILRAALEAGVSIIFDLKGYSTANKGKWVKIISDCVELLMEINLPYGLRHVFFEEAAEVVPQRPGVDVGAKIVYSRIESMARMGRNYALGYTLINQRAEEINKAVFEICEQVLVFRQVGKNSLKSIRSWLDHRGMETAKINAFLASLPKMPNGECWIVNQDEEMHVTIGHKNTFHPDPKKGLTVLPKGATKNDTSDFIRRMKAQMSEKVSMARPDLASAKALKQSVEKNFLLNQNQEDDVDKKEREGYERRIAELERLLAAEKTANVRAMDEAEEERQSLLQELETAKKSKAAAPKKAGVAGNVDYDYIIAEVLKRIPAGTGGAVYQVAPLEMIKKNFLQEAKDRLIMLLSGFDDEQKRIIKWVEQAGAGRSKKDIYTGCFGPGAGAGHKYQDLNVKVSEMHKAGVVRTDDKARVFPRLAEKIKENLVQYDATEAELDNLYSHVLVELLR